MEFRPPGNVVWNLFLAAIPVALAFGMARGVRADLRISSRVRWEIYLPLLLVWLVFLPNTCYLLTEWRHFLDAVTRGPIYAQAKQSKDGILDFLLLLGFYIAYSGSGLLAFFLAIWPLDQLARRWGAWRTAGQAAFFVLCALGVFLGLINRFNSWDLVHPQRLQAIIGATTETLKRPVLLGLILGFGAVLWMLYGAFEIWMDGARLRFDRTRARRLEGNDDHAAS